MAVGETTGSRQGDDVAVRSLAVSVTLWPSMTGIWRLRAAVLTLVGVLAVHDGRYLFANEHELATVHTYFAWLAPAAGALLFLAVAQLAANLSRPEATAPELPRARALWLAATASLLCVYGAQESLEIVFSYGRVPELADLLGSGGWAAIPLAVAAGGVIAALLRGAATVVRWALTRARHPVGRTPVALDVPCTPALTPRGSVLARRLAGRAPPAVS
jgi:hypothetical protein